MKQTILTSGTAAENWFYRHIRPRFDHAPEPIAVLDSEQVVVLANLDRAVSVSDMGREDPAAALDGLMGTALPLARLHSLDLETEAPPVAVPVLPPLDPVPLDLWNSSSGGARTVIAIVQQRSRLAQAYMTARHLTGPMTLVHSDVKPDNVLYEDGAPYLIDWELAGIGAAALDLGAVVGSMVCLWVDHLAVGGDTSVEDWVWDGGVSFESLQYAVAGFVNAYRRSLTAAVFMPVDDIVRAAAMWMVGRTFADAGLGHTITSSQRLRLVVSESLVTHPARLLGENLQ